MRASVFIADRHTPGSVERGDVFIYPRQFFTHEAIRVEEEMGDTRQGVAVVCLESGFEGELLASLKEAPWEVHSRSSINGSHHLNVSSVEAALKAKGWEIVDCQWDKNNTESAQEADSLLLEGQV